MRQVTGSQRSGSKGDQRGAAKIPPFEFPGVELCQGWSMVHCDGSILPCRLFRVIANIARAPMIVLLASKTASLLFRETPNTERNRQQEYHRVHQQPSNQIAILVRTPCVKRLNGRLKRLP